jgi:hypothetical protein
VPGSSAPFDQLPGPEGVVLPLTTPTLDFLFPSISYALGVHEQRPGSRSPTTRPFEHDHANVQVLHYDFSSRLSFVLESRDTPRNGVWTGARRVMYNIPQQRRALVGAKFVTSFPLSIWWTHCVLADGMALALNSCTGLL